MAGGVGFCRAAACLAGALFAAKAVADFGFDVGFALTLAVFAGALVFAAVFDIAGFAAACFARVFGAALAADLPTLRTGAFFFEAGFGAGFFRAAIYVLYSA